jgi:hypothetical protein
VLKKLDGWIMPLIPFHFTLVQNIKRDPFEQAVGVDQKTAMSIGGALGAPSTTFQYDWNMLPIGQQLWLQHLTSYEKYPPLQAPESYPGGGQESQCQPQQRLAASSEHDLNRRAPWGASAANFAPTVEGHRRPTIERRRFSSRAKGSIC